MFRQKNSEIVGGKILHSIILTEIYWSDNECIRRHSWKSGCCALVLREIYLSKRITLPITTLRILDCDWSRLFVYRGKFLSQLTLNNHIYRNDFVYIQLQFSIILVQILECIFSPFCSSVCIYLLWTHIARNGNEFPALGSSDATLVNV